MHVHSQFRPRLLMLTHRFPYPPNRGDRIRSYNLLRVLSKHFHVTLGCTTDERVADVAREHIQKFCEDILVAELSRGWRVVNAFKSLGWGKSLTEGMFASPLLARQVAAWHQTDPFDAILVFCSSMFPFIDHQRFAGAQTVVDLVDVDSQKWRQMGRESGILKNWLYRLESHRVQKLEQRIASRAHAVALVSEQEGELFRQTVSASCPVAGISNGVDTSYFTPINSPLPSVLPPSCEVVSQSAAGNRFGACTRTYGQAPARFKFSSFESGFITAPTPTTRPLKLVFTGVLDYSPNAEGINWFCRQVLPSLRGELDIKLAIVGRRPQSCIERLSALSGVEVIGEVPDVRPFLQTADIAISPLKLARGIQNKVLEAMASGLPVVLTSQSAEGIDAQAGIHFVIADTADEWSKAIVRLARDPSARGEIGMAARRLVATEYSWPTRLGEFVTLLNGHHAEPQS